VQSSCPDSTGDFVTERPTVRAGRDLPNRPSTRRLLAVYAAGVLVPAGFVVLILTRSASDVVARPAAAIATGQRWQAGHALATIAVFVVVAHLGGALAARLRQPRVVGQATAGLLLGPSLLGWALPPLSRWLHAGGSDQAVDLLAQLGVILFVSLTARELSGSGHRTGPAALVVGYTMVAVPLAAGVLTALALDAARPAGIGAVPYALFLGVAMSATALPVLAHILAERRRLTSPIGVLGSSAAAVGDAGIWCLLAVTLCLAGSGSLAGTLVRLGAAVAFLSALWWVVRPLLRRLLPAERDSRYTGPALLLAGVLGSALVTDRLGLHAIFGAFVAGLILPPGSVLVARVTVVIEQATQWLLLPLFFTAIGSRTRLSLVGDPRILAGGALVLAVAVISKVVAAGGAGRAVGLGWRDSAVLGVLMNCRGMTELLVLNTGRTAGIIGADVFTVFVLMAIVTTALTGPLLDLLGWRGLAGPHAGPAVRPVPAPAARPGPG
jgi:Kef-type K+ transport system membrane component KefB